MPIRELFWLLGGLSFVVALFLYDIGRLFYGLFRVGIPLTLLVLGGFVENTWMKHPMGFQQPFPWLWHLSPETAFLWLGVAFLVWYALLLSGQIVLPLCTFVTEFQVRHTLAWRYRVNRAIGTWSEQARQANRRYRDRVLGRKKAKRSQPLVENARIRPNVRSPRDTERTFDAEIFRTKDEMDARRHADGKVSWSELGKQYTKNPKALERILGMEAVLRAMEETIQRPLERPDLHRKYDVPMQAGLLLYGPPGNGKTELAKAVAEALGLYFISVSPSDILGTLVGATEQNIAHLFREAKAHAPAMIFFDEIDAIGYQRGGANPYHDSQLNELLRAIQGFESRHNVFLLAATNRIELLDEALIRKGRFDKHLYVGNPSVKDIQKQLFVWASVLDVDKDVHWLQVAPWLEGCSGAEIRGLVDDWKRQAIDLEYRKKKPILSREYLWGTVDTLRAAKGWPPIPESERTVRWGS